MLKNVKRIEEYVFCRSDGRPYVKMENGFPAAVKRAGIPHIRFHDLRHTFATRYAEKGDILTSRPTYWGRKGLKLKKIIYPI